MSKLRRFVYVRGPHSRVVHIHFGKLIEGEKMACGRRVWLGWKWFSPRPRKAAICRRCENA